MARIDTIIERNRAAVNELVRLKPTVNSTSVTEGAGSWRQARSETFGCRSGACRQSVAVRPERGARRGHRGRVRGPSERRDGNQRSQRECSDKRLHDTSPCLDHRRRLVQRRGGRSAGACSRASPSETRSGKCNVYSQARSHRMRHRRNRTTRQIDPCQYRPCFQST